MLNNNNDDNNNNNKNNNKIIKIIKKKIKIIFTNSVFQFSLPQLAKSNVQMQWQTNKYTANEQTDW